MHEPYEDDDDGYSDDDYDNDYPSNSYQWYYKFDVGPDTPISNWLQDMINKWIGPNAFDGLNDSFEIIGIPGFPSKKFPVNSWNPNTANNKFQYLGSNYHNEPIWKTHYWVLNKMNQEYKAHIQNYAAHFVQQPHYYKGLFDILN